MIRISTCIIIMHALYFPSSALVSNAGNVVIGCQGSLIISDWLELWHIVMLGCVEQAESTEGGHRGNKLVKQLHTQKRRSAHIRKLILNAKYIFVCF